MKNEEGPLKVVHFQKRDSKQIEESLTSYSMMHVWLLMEQEERVL
jgi:hypothetical protein